MERARILDIPVDNISPEEVIKTIKGFILSRTPHTLITANSLMVDLTTTDSGLREAFNRADLVITDSIGIVWASSLLGYPALRRYPGIDLMMNMCRLAAEEKFSVYFLGAREDIIGKAAEILRIKIPSLNIVGIHHGYFGRSDSVEKEVISHIRESKPDILFVGMNIPRQEKWIFENIDELEVPVCMGVGGSFDVISGRLERAPKWVRSIGLEWLHRFLLQPWRIVRIIKLPVFMGKVLLQKYFNLYKNNNAK